MKIATSELEYLRKEVKNCHQIIKDLQKKREFVGLTDKDWNRSKHNYDFQKGVDWAESILKEKNS
jgi:hypothetical protein